MALSPGTRLGNFEILASIGAGGMGEVYKAKDLRLDRIVAIKVLPEHVAERPERKARFDREAKAISRLNHPHICTLYDVGEQDGIDFLVMEYIEGETLAERLTKGALPLEDVVRYAIQIAKGLDRAHRDGIVHRDLKPSNVMISRSGVKLLDFGLAKSVGADPPMESSNSPTRQRDLTKDQSILGTLPYMAPEQLEGKRAEARADIFSFGAVLYEMLTGRPAFQADSQAGLIAAIVHESPPPLTEQRPDAPASLVGLVRHCLNKDPDERWNSGHDLQLALQDILESERIDSDRRHAGGSNRNRLSGVAFGLTALLAVLLAVSVLRGLRPSPAAHQLQQFAVFPPGGVRFTVGEAPILSPDGRYLAFVGTDSSGATLLWIRPLDSLRPRPLPGTEGATFPFWSPDSQSIGFFADGQLKRIEVAGGPPQTIAQSPDSRGGAWSPAGFILFSPRLDAPLYRVSEQGGAVERATSLDPSRKEVSHRLPSFLPDGRRFLFVIQSGDPQNSGLYLASLDSARVDRIGDIQSKAIFTSSGYLLYTRERTLMAQRFDPDRKEFRSDPRVLADKVSGRVGIFAERAFSASRNGELAYWSGGLSLTRLMWFDRRGKQLGPAGEPGLYDSLSLSPDGTKAVLERYTDRGSPTLWIHDFPRGSDSPFSHSPDWGGTWSPDGETIAYGSLRRGSSDIYWKGYSSTEQERLLLESGDFVGPTDWSTDGRYIFFVNYSRSDVGVLPIDPPGDPRLVLDSEFVEKGGRLSPDGRWLAFTSNESGAWEVWIQSFPDPETKLQVSNSGGSHPEWDPEGNELYYIARDRRLMSVALRGDANLQVGVPRVLFQTRVVGHKFKRLYAVADSGERFLMIVPSEDQDSSPITLSLDWTAELEP